MNEHKTTLDAIMLHARLSGYPIECGDKTLSFQANFEGSTEFGYYARKRMHGLETSTECIYLVEHRFLDEYRPGVRQSYIETRCIYTLCQAPSFPVSQEGIKVFRDDPECPYCYRPIVMLHYQGEK